MSGAVWQEPGDILAWAREQRGEVLAGSQILARMEVVALIDALIAGLQGYLPTWAEVTVSEELAKRAELEAIAQRLLGERDRARSLAAALEGELAQQQGVMARLQEWIVEAGGVEDLHRLLSEEP